MEHLNKEEKIKSIAKKYQSLLREHHFFPDYNQELEFYDEVSSATRQHEDWEKFILGVETAYFALPYHQRRIIKCEFFYQNYSFWWEEFFTKKQFKQFKEEAVETFYSNLEKVKVLENLKDNKEEENHKARVIAANKISAIEQGLKDLAVFYEEHSDVLNDPKLNKNIPFKESIDEFAAKFSNWFGDMYPTDEKENDHSKSEIGD